MYFFIGTIGVIELLKSRVLAHITNTILHTLIPNEKKNIHAYMAYGEFPFVQRMTNKHCDKVVKESRVLN